MSSFRRRMLLLILAVLAAFAWWQRPWVEPENAERKQAHDRRPDYTVDKLSAVMMDDAGVPHRQLTALELRHYPDDDTTELEQPVLTLFNQTAPPWRVRSETGWISADGREVIMHGEVFIDRDRGAATRPAHLRTHELLVKPRDDFAATQKPVLATSGADWLTSGAGTRIWFGDPLRIELDGRVRAQFSVDQQTDGTQAEVPEETP